MIIDFSIKNFRSFKERHGISFIAEQSKKTLPENIIEVDLPGIGRLKLLKGIAIMGANASGKSTILDALNTLKTIIIKSFPEYDLLQKVIHPFALNEYSSKEPTEFFIRFISENIRYHYTLVVDTTRVVYESLSSYPQGEEKLIFEREWEKGSYRFDSASSGIKKIEHMVRPDTSLISVAYALNDEDIKPVFMWFQENLSFINSAKHILPRDTQDIFTNKNSDNSFLKCKVLELIKKADFGIDNIAVTKDDQTNHFDQEVNVLFSHVGEDEKKYPLDLMVESGGTYKYFAMAGPIANILLKGEIVGIDELETSLHPLLVRFLLKQFFSEKNNANAQIFFTTHDVNLMQLSFMGLDQFFLAEKNSKGESSITPLSDYYLKENEPLPAGYLAGRYGAIPKIFDINL